MRGYIRYDRLRFICPILIIKQVGHDLNIQGTHTAGEVCRDLCEKVRHRIFGSELVVEIHLVRLYCTIIEKGDVNSDEATVEDCRVLDIVARNKSASHEFTSQLRLEYIINTLIKPISLLRRAFVVR